MTEKEKVKMRATLEEEIEDMKNQVSRRQTQIGDVEG